MKREKMQEAPAASLRETCSILIRFSFLLQIQCDHCIRHKFFVMVCPMLRLI